MGDLSEPRDFHLQTTETISASGVHQTAVVTSGVVPTISGDVARNHHLGPGQEGWSCPEKEGRPRQAAPGQVGGSYPGKGGHRGEEGYPAGETSGVGDLTPEEIRRECRRIWRNVILLGVGFFLLFSAFGSLSSLQSSLHTEQGMGVIAQAVLYASFALACLLLTKPLLGALGHKWSMVVSFTGYILWMLANGYPRWGTMVPASILAGVSAAPLWIGQSAYLNKQSKYYSLLTGEEEKDVIAKFFGVFYAIFNCNFIPGPLISSLVLFRDSGGANQTLLSSMSAEELGCGALDCPWNNATNVNRQLSGSTIWILLGIYLGISVVALLICIFAVDRLPLHLRDRKMTQGEVRQNLADVFRLIIKPEQLLLMPISLYIGIQLGFQFSDFSKSYVTCTLGIWMVGYTTLPFGILLGVTGLAGGYLAKAADRITVMCLGYACHISAGFAMMFWYPTPDQAYVMFILAGLRGIGEGFIKPQTNALVGSLYDAKQSDAAFSIFWLWQSVGTIISFAYGDRICTNHKLYVMTAVLFLSLLTYALLEWRIRRRVKVTPRTMGTIEVKGQGDKVTPVTMGTIEDKGQGDKVTPVTMAIIEVKGQGDKVTPVTMAIMEVKGQGEKNGIHSTSNGEVN